MGIINVGVSGNLISLRHVLEFHICIRLVTHPIECACEPFMGIAGITGSGRLSRLSITITSAVQAEFEWQVTGPNTSYMRS
jgi:hypothetical protein